MEEKEDLETDIKPVGGSGVYRIGLAHRWTGEVYCCAILGLVIRRIFVLKHTTRYLLTNGQSPRQLPYRQVL